MKSLLALLLFACLPSLAMAEVTAESSSASILQQKLPLGLTLKQREVWLREAAERGELSPEEAKAWRNLQRRLHRKVTEADEAQIEAKPQVKRPEGKGRLPRLRWRIQQDAWHTGHPAPMDAPDIEGDTP